MDKTWKPTTAGIISIVAGVLNIIVGRAAGFAWFYGGYIEIDTNAGRILSAVTAPTAILGVVSIVGGVFAIRRRLWGPALAGAICALFRPPAFILGIPAITFLLMGKREFE